MTLIDLAKKYQDEPRTSENDMELIQMFKKLDIHPDVVNDDKQTFGDDNSWEDVRTKLVDTTKMSLTDYGKFYKLMNQ